FNLHVDVHDLRGLTRAARWLRTPAVPSRGHVELMRFLEHGCKFTQHSIERDRQVIVEPFPLRERRQDGGMPPLEKSVELALVRADVVNRIPVEKSSRAGVENHDLLL